MWKTPRPEQGGPPHDRFNAILAAIKLAEFEKCLPSWITALHEVTDGQVVAIEARRLGGASIGPPARRPSTWLVPLAMANQTSVGQVVLEEKNNEITAIPQTAGNVGNYGLFGHDRCCWMPNRDCPTDCRAGRRLLSGSEAKPADAP